MQSAKIDTTDYALLVELLEDAGAKMHGSYFVCPWHDDTTASGSVYTDDEGNWHAKCHACGTIKDAQDLMTRSSPTESHAPQVKTWETLEALTGSFNGSVVAKYDYGDGVVLRLAPKSFRSCHEDDGRWILRAPPKPWKLFRRDEITDKKAIVVVEGEEDVLALEKLGIAATTSRSGSKSSKHSDWSALSGKQVVIWRDNDENGAEYSSSVTRALELLPEPPSKIAYVSPGKIGLTGKGDDPRDFIQQVTADGADAREAVTTVLNGVLCASPMSRLMSRLQGIYSGKLRPVTSPWPSLDQFGRCWLPGSVAVLSAEPGTGKSFFALAFAMHVHEKGFNVSMLCIEEPIEWHMHRALAIRERLGHMADVDWVEQNPDIANQAVERQYKFLDEFGRCLVCPENTDHDYEYAITWLENACKRNRLVILDAISLLDEGEEGRIWVLDKRLIKKAKAASEAYGSTVLLITHPKQTPPGKTQKRPSMNNLCGGAAIQRCCSSVLWMKAEREASTYNRELYILKSRDGIGRHEPLYFKFDASVNFVEVYTNPSC